MNKTPAQKTAFAIERFCESLHRYGETSFIDGGSKIYQYLCAPAVGELFEQHASGQEGNHKILFSLAVFEQWLRAHESPVAASS